MRLTPVPRLRSIRLAVPAAVLLLTVTAAAAQSGSLEIRVVDEAGPLAGATVSLSNELGYLRPATRLTGEDGIVRFPVLRAGDGYTIRVAMEGYGTVRKPGISIHLNTTVTETILLATELVEVVVTRSRPDLINLEKTETTNRFSDEFIQDLPVPGRFYQSVLTLAPGVQDADGDGNPNVHGSRERDFKTIVSGISNVDPLTGMYMSNINPNSIEELEVITAGAGVEHSRAQGGFARIIQKQGSNEYEGVFDFIYRSHLLDGNGAGNTASVDLPDFEWRQPGFQLTGPILRDRLWFRLSHEFILREDPVDVLTGLEVVTTDAATHSDQVTWQVSPRNKLSFLFNSNPIRIENVGVSSQVPPELTSVMDSRGDSYSVTWTAPVSPGLLVESTAGYQDLQYSLTPTTTGIGNDCVPSYYPALREAQCVNMDLGVTLGSFPTVWHDNRQRFTLSTLATVHGGRFWGMTHQFKFGFLAENERYFRDVTRNPILWRFTHKFVVENELTGEGALQITEYVSGLFYSPVFSRDRATGTNWGVFVEDRVKPASNLTVTLGARLDREFIDCYGKTAFDPSEQLATYLEGSEGLSLFEKQKLFRDSFWQFESMEDFYAGLNTHFGFPLIDPPFSDGFTTRHRQPESIHIVNDNVSPFLSVAWDPWSDGKTKIGFSARRYYDKIFLAVPLIEIEPARSSVLMTHMHKFPQWIPEGYLWPTANQQSTVDVRTVDHNLRTPYQDEFALSLERELAMETALRVTYVHRRYRDQLQDYDINHLPGDFGRCTFPTEAGEPAVAPITDPADPLYGLYPYGGDGILDDCVGIPFYRPLENPLGTDPGPDPGSGGLGPSLEEGWPRPDGILDLYVQNPFWGDIRQVSNNGSADYEAIVLEVNRRQYRGWEIQGSYTWSRAEGDGEDYSQVLGDDRTLQTAEEGYQSYDQRHVVKINATSITPWGFRLGTAVTWQSGLPYSVMERLYSYEPLPPILDMDVGHHNRQRIVYSTGKRNDQRNPDWWNVDVKLTREMRLPHDLNLQLSLEVFNLLNDDTYMVYNFSPGYRSGRQLDGDNEATRRFGRRFQVGLKLMF